MTAIPYNMITVNRGENKSLFTVISLFAGCGGSSTGYRIAGGRVLVANEFIPAARDTYFANYPNTIIIPDDIRNINGGALLKVANLKQGELDILDGSPPCSAFSAIGQREKSWGKIKKYSDTTQRVDDLFFEFSRILKEIQPRVFIAENVKGLTIGASNNIFNPGPNLFHPAIDSRDIISELKICGYRVEYKVLNAVDYGVPQYRERLIIIGVRNDIKIKPTHPVRTVRKYISTGEALSNITNNDLTGTDFNPDAKLTKYFLKCAEGQSIVDVYSKDKKIRYGFNFMRYDRKKPAPTLVASGAKYYMHYDENRNISIAEAKRIMSFPDDFILTGTFTQQFERLGRAVPPLMMEAIANHVYKTILHVSDD